MIRSFNFWPVYLIIGFFVLPASFKYPDPPADPPNIVFLFSDDQTAADLGCYSNTVVRTPNLVKLAAEGVRFTRAYVASPQCSPSRGALLTGRVPHTTGSSRLHTDVLPEFPTIVEALKKQGYFTAAYRKVHQKIIEQQFDFKGDKDLSAFFAKRPKNKPFFLWFGSTDPHRPYTAGAVSPPHDPETVQVPGFLANTPGTRQDLALYYDYISRFDKDCGEILALLDQHGLTGNTLIVMSSDNGMPFPRAKGTLYEAGINVPLLIKWPGKTQAGRISGDIVSLIDLPVTWLEAAGAPLLPRMTGKSLIPYLKGSTQPIHEYVFTERNWHDNWEPARAVVSGKYKLIQNFRPEVAPMPTLDRLTSPAFRDIDSLHHINKLALKLNQWYFGAPRPVTEFYDLQKDPGEWNNLATDPHYKQMVLEYQKILSDWMNATNDFLPAPRTSFPGYKFNDVYEPLNSKKL